ncbi:MAG: cupin domain-containing protein [Hyphomonadaceae bacterium]|nr:cupin domain-containing protein [Hyphomonadaceae bacterium]
MAAIDPRTLSSEEREAFHQAAEAEITTFDYQKPVPNGRPKQNTWLVRRPNMQVVIQCVHDGGENNLHYHTHSETTWFVLKGRAIFYGVDDKVLGDLTPMQGIVIPGGSRYKFCKAGDGDLEILQMVAVMEPSEEEKSQRINVEPHREWMADSKHLQTY